MASNGPIRILMVDDDVADAELIAEVLAREGLSFVFDRVDTPTAFQQRLGEGYDIILADHDLRSWTAMDALDLLRRSGREIPFVVVTGVLGDERAVEYLKHGASDYVLKEHLERLPAALARALQEKAQRDENTRLQQEIRKAKDDWERTFEAISDSIMLLDGEGRILRANAATAEVIGEQNGNCLGALCFTGVHKLSGPIKDCPLQHMLVSGNREQAEITDDNLQKILHVSVFPLRNGGGDLQGAIHVMRDITEQKQLEHEMLQAHKLEAIGRLAGGVAHDFNNILGVIQGYSEIVEEQIPETLSALRQHVAEIRKAAYRGAGVTRQLLAFSRKQVMQLRPVKLTDAVRDLEKMLCRLIGENIEFVVRAADDVGVVNVDPVQIQQVLINLVINARDAMPSGGRLTITTGNVTLDSHYPRIHDPVAPGDYVLVTVSDTGIGMDRETVSHIFEPFFTTKGEGKGTGFGLSIVYGIVKQSGGYIWVYSEPGHGTMFKIYLPRIEQDESKVVPITPATQARQKPATILLVEDEESLARMVATVLHASGYTVLNAATAESARRIAQVYQQSIDLLLSDVILRGSTNGLELATELSNMRPEMKLLFMSGYSDALNRADGNNNYLLLEKPFTNIELRRTVLEVLNGSDDTSAGFEREEVHRKVSS